MTWYMVVLVFLVLLGAVTLAYQVFRMTSIDAKSRGLKHPHFWGMFALSGEGSGGLLLYLLGRRKYPSNMSMGDRASMDSCKKKAGVSLILLALSAICLMAVCILKF